MLPCESKSIEAGRLAGTLNTSKVSVDLLNLHIAFCLSSVNQMLPLSSAFAAHDIENSVGLERAGHDGIAYSFSKPPPARL
jgi:hypothetical protein